MFQQFRTALAVLAVAALASVACNSTTVDTPTSTSAPEPVASTSTPTPSANPSPAPTPSAGEGEEPKPAWEVSCSAVGQMTVAYNGEASHAEVLTYYTSFDGPQQFGKETKILPTGEQFTRTFPACSQGDAEPTSGKPAGHCYFDKNGVPFNEKRNPEKVTECRTPPPPQCEARWIEDEEPTVNDPEWGSCSASVPAFSFRGTKPQSPLCSKKRTVTYTYYETNSCTQERRVKRVVERLESEKCDCPPPPPPGFCFYEVTGQNKQSKCEAKDGDWENWDNETHHNHCRLTYPGISDNSFNLTPGQSDNGCLRKQDD